MRCGQRASRLRSGFSTPMPRPRSRLPNNSAGHGQRCAAGRHGALGPRAERGHHRQGQSVDGEGGDGAGHRGSGARRTSDPATDGDRRVARSSSRHLDGGGHRRLGDADDQEQLKRSSLPSPKVLPCKCVDYSTASSAITARRTVQGALRTPAPSICTSPRKTDRSPCARRG